MTPGLAYVMGSLLGFVVGFAVGFAAAVYISKEDKT